MPSAEVDSLDGLSLLTTSGEPVVLASLWREQPLLLFFLRHFGCAVCRAELLRVRDHDADFRSRGATIAAISAATPEATERFSQRYRLPFPILANPDRSVYRAFGLAEGSLLEVGGPAVLLRQARESLRGNIATINPFDTIRQLGGVFIVDTAGSVRFGHVAQPIYYYPSVETYLHVFDQLQMESNNRS